MSYPRYMSTPSSGSIEEIADSATTTPDSCTDFFGTRARLPGAAFVKNVTKIAGCL